MATNISRLIAMALGLSIGAVSLAYAADPPLPPSQQLSTYPASPNGMTWVHKISNSVTGTITVGCDSTAPDKCNPYQGDTACTEARPVLCIYKPPFQVPTGVDNSNQYNRWSGGSGCHDGTGGGN